MQQLWDDLRQTFGNVRSNARISGGLVVDIFNNKYELFQKIFRLNHVSCFK